MTVYLIAAVSENDVIGMNGKLPWRLPLDLKWFKMNTKAGAVIMGRKTWDSLPVKPLPNRLNIVVSRRPRKSHGDTIWCTSFSVALLTAHSRTDPRRAPPRRRAWLDRLGGAARPGEQRPARWPRGSRGTKRRCGRDKNCTGRVNRRGETAPPCRRPPWRRPACCMPWGRRCTPPSSRRSSRRPPRSRCRVCCLEDA